MVKSKEDIINDINNNFGLNERTVYSNYYVGITKNIESRLFSDHAVDRDNDYWIYRTANSKTCAEDIEKHFLGLGMDGDTGGGKEESTIVYCYKKNSHTNP